MLHPQFDEHYEDYYAKSLSCFRQDVCDPKNLHKDTILVAGLLLCYISVSF